MSAPRFDAVVFDMDGLLIDSERPIRDAWIEVTAQAGRPLTAEDYLGVIGTGIECARPHLQALLGEGLLYDDVRERVRLRLLERYGQTGYAPKPGARELLGWLQERGVPCGVASSTYLPEIERRLGLVGFLPSLQAVAGGDEVEHPKPQPDVYLLAAHRLGVDPARCLAFEDTETGSRAAVAAGMQVVVVPDLKPPGAALAPLMMLGSLADVLAHLPGWFAR